MDGSFKSTTHTYTQLVGAKQLGCSLKDTRHGTLGCQPPEQITNCNWSQTPILLDASLHPSTTQV